MDENNILKIADYPLLFKNINAIEILDDEGKGTGTFAMPNFYDGTTRHLPKGSSRALGSYQEDAMQRITGEIQKTVHYLTPQLSGAFYGEVGKSLGGKGSDFPCVASIYFDNSRVARTDNETRMKNTAGQWYILAKVNV